MRGRREGVRERQTDREKTDRDKTDKRREGGGVMRTGVRGKPEI